MLIPKKKVYPEGIWRLNYDSRRGSREPNNEIVLKKIDDRELNYGSSSGKNFARFSQNIRK